MVPFQYLSNSCRTAEISLTNSEINLIVTANCLLSHVENQVAVFAITDTKLYVTVETLSTQNNAKLLEHLNN